MKKWSILLMLFYLICISTTTVSSDSQSETNRMCDAVQGLLDSGMSLCRRQVLSQDERIQLISVAILVKENILKADLDRNSKLKEQWDALKMLAGIWVREGCTRGDFEDRIKKVVSKKCPYLSYPK